MTTMLPESFTIADEFPPVDYDQWRVLVDEALKGAPFDKKLVTRTYEGIPVQPLYTSRDVPDAEDPMGVPGSFPFVRGATRPAEFSSVAELRQLIQHPDLEKANRQILDDLEGGVPSVLIRLDAASRRGVDPNDPDAASGFGVDGVTVYCVDHLDQLLADVHLEMIALAIDAGAAYLPAAACVAELWNRRGLALEEARVAFNADPLSELARTGALPTSIDVAAADMARLAAWCESHCPQATAAAVDSTVYHSAGASATQDIAFAAATAVEYLRWMTKAGMSLDAAASQMVFRMAVGTQHFLSIGKLRAARWVWARVLEACGGSAAVAPMQIHAATGIRVLTKRDPYVNLLRNTVGLYSAVLGGADWFTSVPFDALMGLPTDFSRRIARNTGHVLIEESHLAHVRDPAGGSWYLDHVTQEIAESAWEIFQQVEREGGMTNALQSGWIAEQIEAAWQPRERDLALRKSGITGVSEFPNVLEEPVEREEPDLEALREQACRALEQRPNTAADNTSQLRDGDCDMDAMIAAAGRGATIGELSCQRSESAEVATMSKIGEHRFAAAWETLRDACDRWEQEHGQRPLVFQANLGSPAHHTARATWSKNFFEAGGFLVQSNDGFETAADAAQAFEESGANVAVICSSDKLYPQFVPDMARLLQEAGARTIVLAGHPGDNESAWRDTGVNEFIYMKCNVLETLQRLLREHGVLTDGGQEQ